jgi:hypothetical protein
MANLLQSLKLSVTQRTRTFSPVVHRRNRLLTQITEQIEAATAEDSKAPFVPVVERMVRDEVSGESKKVNRIKRFRRCWWLNADGACFLELRYGSRPLEIAKGKSAIEVGERKKLFSTLELLRDAVLMGELDDQLQSAASRVGASLKGKRLKSQ